MQNTNNELTDLYQLLKESEADFENRQTITFEESISRLKDEFNAQKN